MGKTIVPRHVWPEAKVRFADADDPREKTAFDGFVSCGVLIDYQECLGSECPMTSDTCDRCRLNPDTPKVAKKIATIHVELHRSAPRPKLTLGEAEFYAMEMASPTVRGKRLRHMRV